MLLNAISVNVTGVFGSGTFPLCRKVLRDFYFMAQLTQLIWESAELIKFSTLCSDTWVVNFCAGCY